MNYEKIKIERIWLSQYKNQPKLFEFVSTEFKNQWPILSISMLN